MDGDRTVNKLRIALVSYDRKELRVQKQYLQEQDSMVVCTCYQSGGKLLEELQQGVRYEIVVLCSQMVDMSSLEFVTRLRRLERKPLLMLFDEGRRRNSTVLRMEPSDDFYYVEDVDLQTLLREIYRMPGQRGQQMELDCQKLYESWGMQLPDINCSYLTSAVSVVYAVPQKMDIRKEVLQAVSTQYSVSVAAVDSGIRRMVDQLENRNTEPWEAFKRESGLEKERPTTGKLIYAVKNHLTRHSAGE